MSEPTVWGPAHRDMTDLLSGHPDDVPAVVDQLSKLQDVLERVPPRHTANPLADFNRRYLSITEAVLDRLYDGGFDDPAFLSRLDVEFAARYFDALRQWGEARNGCPRVWKVLLGRIGGPQTPADASASAGITAHLNFDLPFALVTTFDHRGCDPIDDGEQHRDYLRIAEIFATAVPGLQDGCLDKWQLLIDTMNGDLDDGYQGETIEYTRNVAWRNAQKLWGVRHDLAALARERDRLDANAAALGRLLLSPLGSFLQ